MWNRRGFPRGSLGRASIVFTDRGHSESDSEGGGEVGIPKIGETTDYAKATKIVKLTTEKKKTEMVKMAKIKIDFLKLPGNKI